MKCQSTRCQTPASGPTMHGRSLCSRCKLSIVVNAPMRAERFDRTLGRAVAQDIAPNNDPKPRNEHPPARSSVGTTLTADDVETLRILLAFARRQGYVQTAAVLRLTHWVAGKVGK